MHRGTTLVSAKRVIGTHCFRLFRRRGAVQNFTFLPGPSYANKQSLKSPKVRIFLLLFREKGEARKRGVVTNQTFYSHMHRRRGETL